MENLFGYVMVQDAQSWSQSSPSTAGSTAGKSAVVVGAVVNASPDLEMLVEEAVGVRKVRARWRADFMVKRGWAFRTVVLAGAMTE